MHKAAQGCPCLMRLEHHTSLFYVGVNSLKLYAFGDYSTHECLLLHFQVSVGKMSPSSLSPSPPPSATSHSDLIQQTQDRIAMQQSQDIMAMQAHLRLKAKEGF